MTTLSIMANNNVSITVKATDQATGPLNKIAGNINSLANNTKKSTSGLTQFGNSLKNLKNAVPGIGLVAGAVTGVVAAISGAIKKMSEWEQAWAKVEQSAIKLDIAEKINSGLKGSSLELKKFASDLSSTLKNTISGGEIMEAMSGIAFDKTAEQVKQITSVGADLAAVMGTDLNSAMSQLNNTFSGSVGTLGKYFPELKKLTKEELEAGKALDIVKGKVEGTSEALADSAQGSMTAYKNAMGDLKEELGAIVTNFFQPLRDWLTSITKGWADALAEKRKYNEYDEKMNNGEITQGSDIEEYIRLKQNKYNELEGNAERFKYDSVSGEISGEYESYQRQMEEIANEIKAAEEKLIWARNAEIQEEIRQRKATFLEEQRVLQERIANEKQLAEEAAEAARKAAWEKMDAENTQRIKSISTKVYGNKKTDLDASISDLAQQSTITLEAIQNLLKSTDSDYDFSSKVNSQWSAWSQEVANDYMASAESNLLNKIEAEREKQLQKQEEEAEKDRKAEEERQAKLRQTITGAIGDFGKMIEASYNQDWQQLILSYVAQLIEKVSSESDILSQVFNFVGTVIDSVAPVLAEILELVGKPLLSLLDVLARTVVKLLEVLEPIFEYIIAPAVKVIGTVVITILGSIYNGIVAIQHAIVWDKKKQWQYMDIGQEITNLWNDAGYSSSSGSGTSSTGTSNASYTAARDIYITINYNDSYVNGDAMAIAINLRDKIREAERMGY